MGPKSQYALVGAALIFLANMVLAWWQMARSHEFIARDLTARHAGDGEDTAAAQALTLMRGASVNEHVFLNRIVEAETHLRAVSNKHTIVVVSMAGAFALMGLGFALYVMGAEGSLELAKGDANEPTLGPGSNKGTLVLQASTPGITCFALATAVILFALSRETSIQFNGFSVYPDLPGARPATLPPPPKVPADEGAGLDKLVDDATQRVEKAGL